MSKYLLPRGRDKGILCEDGIVVGSQEVVDCIKVAIHGGDGDAVIEQELS